MDFLVLIFDCLENVLLFIYQSTKMQTKAQFVVANHVCAITVILVSCHRFKGNQADQIQCLVSL